MTRETQYGVRLPNSGPFATVDDIWRMAERTDALGYDSAWVHDHISWGRDMLTHFGAGSVEAVAGQDPHFYESLTTVAVVGSRYRRLRVGIAGLVLPLRDPRVLAKQLATTSELLGPGRLIIATAIGNIPNDFEAMGVRWDRRGRITTDHLEALLAILRGPQPVSFESQTLTFGKGSFYPQPRGLTIWVTGKADAGLKRAARYGDGWLTGNATPAEYGVQLAKVRSAAAAAGRDPNALQAAMEIFVCVAKTRDAAIALSRASLERRHASLERALTRNAIGTPRDVLEMLERYREAGVRFFELKFIFRTMEEMDEMMALVAEEALTALA